MLDIVFPTISQRLVLIRGLPGEGKTALAQIYVAKGYRHFEADHFFMKNGYYEFIKGQLPEAHAWCLAQARLALKGGESACVANVFAAIEDIKPYTELGVEYEVVEATRAGRSIHNVPTATLNAMKSRWVPTDQLVQALKADASWRRSTVSVCQNLSNLTFPDMDYGKMETPWDLRRFLYRGGAGMEANLVGNMIDAGELGQPLVERIELVWQIHEVLANALGRGAKRKTVDSCISNLVRFFKWEDETGARLELESVEHSYHSWADMLLERVRVGRGLSEVTAYSYASVVGRIVDRVLGRSSPVIKATRLRRPKSGSRAVSSSADKQNLEETFAFGHLLIDIADALNLQAIWGPLPVTIPLRNGQILEEWSGTIPRSPRKVSDYKCTRQAKYNAKCSAKARSIYEADRTLRTRYPLVNLRIQVEMFMLMGQPAVNLGQVHQLRMCKFSFKASAHGYEVRAYKHRRGGRCCLRYTPSTAKFLNAI